MAEAQTSTTTDASSLTVRDILSGAPAVTAVALGILYGLGVLLNASEQLGAGLHVPDTLPLVPLQDHLTKALATVFGSLLLGVLFLVTVGFGLWAVGHSRVTDREFGELQARASRLNSAVEQTGEQYAELASIQAQESPAIDAELDALREELAGRDPDEQAPQELVDRVRAARERLEPLMDRARRQGEAQEAVRADLERTQALVGTVEGRIRIMRRFTASSSRLLPWMGWAYIITVPLVPPIQGAGNVALGLFFILGYRLFRRDPVLALVVAVFLMLTPYLIDAYVYPAPLPPVTVVTPKGTVRGALITQTEGRTAVATGRGSFRVIPVSQELSVTVQKPKKREPRSLLHIVF